jgi:hypothetical protein
VLFSTKPDSNRPNTWFLQKIKAFASRQFYIEIWYTTKYQILEINEKDKESVDMKTRTYGIVKKININMNKKDNNLKLTLI